MRKLVRVGIVIIVVGICTIPMLYGRKPAAGNPGRQVLLAPRLAFQIGGVGSGEWSEPGLLLVLGLGLMVSAGRLPAILRMSARLQRIQAKRVEGPQKSLPGEGRADAKTLLKFGPPAQNQSSWPGQSRASNGTLG